MTAIKKAPLIPVRPMTNMVIVEKIHIQSKTEKSLEKKNPNLIMTKDQIEETNQQKLASSGDLLDVWDTHPTQGIVVAVDEKVSEMNNINVGDRIAWRPIKEVGFYMVFNKKKYVCLYPHDIIMTYLTDKV